MYKFNDGDVGTAKKLWSESYFKTYAHAKPGLYLFETFGLEKEIFTASPFQNLILDQNESFRLTSSNGDLLYEGEITNSNSPMTATANPNRCTKPGLSMRVKCVFLTRQRKNEDFENLFHSFIDYPSK